MISGQYAPPPSNLEILAAIAKSQALFAAKGGKRVPKTRKQKQQAKTKKAEARRIRKLQARRVRRGKK